MESKVVNCMFQPEVVELIIFILLVAYTAWGGERKRMKCQKQTQYSTRAWNTRMRAFDKTVHPDTPVSACQRPYDSLKENFGVFETYVVYIVGRNYGVSNVMFAKQQLLKQILSTYGHPSRQAVIRCNMVSTLSIKA